MQCEEDCALAWRGFQALICGRQGLDAVKRCATKICSHPALVALCVSGAWKVIQGRRRRHGSGSVSTIVLIRTALADIAGRYRGLSRARRHGTVPEKEDRH